MHHVVDTRSNVKDNIVGAAEFIGKSKWRQDIFREIYRGKPRPKTANEIATRLHRTPRRVLTTGNELRKHGLVDQLEVDGRVAYRKDPFLDQHKRRILRLAANREARDRIPTKVRPAGGMGATIRLRVSKPFSIKQVTVDDIASFAKVRKVKKLPAGRLALPEKAFKEGVKRVIGEPGKFVDSPAERFDLLSTRVMLRTKRIAAAFAFKGPGRKGILRPAAMGRNGDQIQRLFKSEAELFFVQYWGQVDESVIEQIRTFATVRSLHTGDRVSYGVIDGKDSDRLVLAYPNAFQQRSSRGKR